MPYKVRERKPEIKVVLAVLKEFSGYKSQFKFLPEWEDNLLLTSDLGH